MPTCEINTDTLIENCVTNNKIIYVPEVGTNFELCNMELRQVILKEDDDSNLQFHKHWPTNKWNIPEPPTDMPYVIAKQPSDIDIMIIPGLGFNRKLHRLGQGKGYYDRFLSRMKEKLSTKDNNEKMPLLVAVALTPQLVDDDNGMSIPVAEYDQTMDMIVLPNEIIMKK